MTGWLPIETAPKDGTPVVVFDGTTACVAHFVPEMRQGRYTLHSWWVRCDRRQRGITVVCPTRWMPYKGTLFGPTKFATPQ
jgi:hypothetical protein